MTVHYEMDPQAIEQESFRQIRQLTSLSGYSPAEQQVVMRVVHSTGMPEVAERVKFSANACQAGQTALAQNAAILCDVEMVKQGLTKRMLVHEPRCFLNNSQTLQRAKETGETRSMAAVQQWLPQLAGSVVIIGNAPTALFRLLELVAEVDARPALVIGIPVGFVGAAESKQHLWDKHLDLGLECITLLGRQGGSAIAAAVCNALLRCNRNEWY